MSILLDDSSLADSESEKKGKAPGKRLKGFQREGELVSLKELMTKITFLLQTEYQDIFYKGKTS